MRIVILGNGVAGVSTAEAIRAEDKLCEIVLITHELHTHYSRPRLIDLLANKVTIEEIIIRNPSWYEKNAIELVRATRIVGVDFAAKRLWDTGGNSFFYDKLVVATGAVAHVPPFMRPHEKDVYTLRTIDDAEAIKRTAMERKKATVIGGGLLGLEITGSLRALDVEVRVIEILDRLLPRQLDRKGSEILQKMLEDKGFSFRTGVRTESVEPSEGSLRVNLTGAEAETADFVVISAGIVPDLAVFNGTGIGRNRGITVDHHLRTNIPDVYCCGDAAEYLGTICGLWQAGREQGIVCGGHIAGKEIEYTGTVPSTRLKVAGVDVASMGEIENIRDEATREITESNFAAGTYKKLFVRGTRLVGAILIGNVKEAGMLQQKIKRGEEPPG